MKTQQSQVRQRHPHQSNNTTEEPISSNQNSKVNVSALQYQHNDAIQVELEKGLPVSLPSAELTKTCFCYYIMNG